MPRSTSLLLIALLLLNACSDPEPSDNNAPDTADAAPDLAAPDMRPAPTGPQDCLADEWFSTDGPKCNSCPTPALTCDALILNPSSIRPIPDTLSFNINLARLEPISVIAQLSFVRTICSPFDPNNPDAPPICDKAEPEMTSLAIVWDAQAQVWSGQLVIEGGRLIEVTVTSIEVTDRCGVKNSFSMTGGWEMVDNMLTAPLNCVAPAP